MRIHTITRDGGTEGLATTERPDWQPLPDFEGTPLEQVQVAELERIGALEVQLVHIAAGGDFAMHASPDTSVCQVVHGAGVMRLPDGTDVAFDGPGLFVFHPDALHRWTDITADTLLAVCIVDAAAAPGG